MKLRFYLYSGIISAIFDYLKFGGSTLAYGIKFAESSKSLLTDVPDQQTVSVVEEYSFSGKILIAYL